MTTRLHPVLQWLLLAAFFAWATILMIIICGQENPKIPLSLFDLPCSR